MAPGTSKLAMRPPKGRAALVSLAGLAGLETAKGVILPSGKFRERATRTGVIHLTADNQGIGP